MAAIWIMFSWLTEKGVLAMNPAREVKTERFSRTEGKTPAFVKAKSKSFLTRSRRPLSQQIRVFPIDPIDFIAELHRRWCKKHLAPLGDPYLMSKAHREKHRAPGCIFVSYASPDLEIAPYIVSQLQNADCLVWFDKEQLQPVENWEEELREAVEERCGLFLSIIFNHTAVRLEGFNIFERNLAGKRREKFADNAIFYLPLRIDEGEPLIPANEPRGTKKIQGVRKPGGHLDEEFIAYLRDIQRANRSAGVIDRN